MNVTENLDPGNPHKLNSDTYDQWANNKDKFEKQKRDSYSVWPHQEEGQ